jgi:hypothetical protein
MSKASDMAAVYAAWWRRLTPGQQVSLVSGGFDPKNPSWAGIPLAHRYVDSDRSSHFDGVDSQTDNTFKPFAISPRGYDVDYALAMRWQAEMAQQETLMSERTFTFPEMLDILRKVIAPWTDSQSPDVRLFGTCQYIALGVPGQPTMTELAKKHGVTRAEISRRVKHIQRKMNLPPSMYMKSDHACARLKRK